MWYQARETDASLYSGLKSIFKEKYILNHLLGFQQYSWVDKRTGSTARLYLSSNHDFGFLASNLAESWNFSMDRGGWYHLPCQLVKKALGLVTATDQALGNHLLSWRLPTGVPRSNPWIKVKNYDKKLIGMFANNMSFDHMYLGLHQQEP